MTNNIIDCCEFGKARNALKRILTIIDNEITEIGSAFYDDPITAIYNSVDDAILTFRCYCGENEETTNVSTN